MATGIDPHPDPDRGVYGISVAAELAGTGSQNLRAYEARGLVTPDRSDGGTRRYSANDLVRLRRIGDLLKSGLNLAGIAMVLPLQDELVRLRAQKEGATMTPDSSAASEPVPEADLIEQRTPAVASSDEEALDVPVADLTADPADRWEQALPVGADEDDDRRASEDEPADER